MVSRVPCWLGGVLQIVDYINDLFGRLLLVLDALMKSLAVMLSIKVKAALIHSS